MSTPYTLKVDERCRHGHPVERYTARRVPFGNEVRWQVRVFYDCPEGCRLSDVRDEKPSRVLHTGGEEVRAGDEGPPTADPGPGSGG